MSREIKFRIYNDEDDRMEDVAGITMFCDDGCLVDTSFEGGDESEWCVPMQLMQYTGLRDINCVEIYEGDIVSDHVGVGQVKYSEKHGAFRVCYGDGLAKWFFDYILRGERESIEVIGNIHQNPELLEE